MSSLYREAKDGEIHVIGIIVENKHINGLEINLECVINNRFSVFASGININQEPKQMLNISNP